MRAFLLPTLLAATACSGGGGRSASGPLSAVESPVAAAIYEIQGSGTTSPLAGKTVTVAGIVTGDFQDGDGDERRNLGGFFIQSPPDGDLATSDGVFVFDGSGPATDVSVGDSVRVVGSVTEYFGETQIAARGVTIVGAGVLLPVPVNLPATGVATNSDGLLIADLERFEGMLVRFPQTLTVSGLRNLERYGGVRLAAGGRPYQFTNRNPPDPAAYEEHRLAFAAREIVLDDGRREAYARPIAYIRAASRPGAVIRVGDAVTDLTGNLRFSRGSGAGGMEAYRLMPTVEPAFVSRNPRPATPAVGGNLRAAAINAHNLFSTVDVGLPACGPAGDANCRGADSPFELDRQLGKLATLLEALDADIVAIVEIENNGGGAVDLLIDRLNGVAGRRYAAVSTGRLGDDAITPAIIYDVASVATEGPPAILDARVDPRFNDDRNRPALAQAFRRIADGAVLSVVATHLKSKGSDCDADGDPNVGDGQGNCNRTRTLAAAALADWVTTDPTGSGDPDYLLVGDLNAYVFEDPLTELKAAGFTNLLQRASGGDAYSFVFDAQSGALDHALASPSLLPQVVDAVEWHVNADEAPALDYNLENDRDPALFDAGTPYRSGDHDPLVIGLELGN